MATWFFQWVDVAVKKKRACWPLGGLGCLVSSLHVRSETLVSHHPDLVGNECMAHLAQKGRVYIQGKGLPLFPVYRCW